MTEKDALTRWCPFAMVAMTSGTVNVAANRGLLAHAINSHNHCVGDGCMAWRWDDKDSTEGHCGLAGGQ